MSSRNSGKNVTKINLPVQRVEKPTAIHEEIRREQVEEIQPVVNIEKYKTEVIQKTQPLLDKEVKPVHVEQKYLPSETLPEVVMRGTDSRMDQDKSTVNYLETRSVTVEKPPIINETENRQIIEEVQPVIYKETVVPTLIRETKPVYQKVVEGTTYQSETLAPRQLNASNSPVPLHSASNQPAPIPIERSIQPNDGIIIDVQALPQAPVQIPIEKVGLDQNKDLKPNKGGGKTGLIEEKVVTIVTTTTNSPYQPIQTM